LFIPDPDPDFLPIPDPGVKKYRILDPGVKKATDHGSMGKKGTGSWIRIRNTELNTGELEQVKRMVSNMSITEEDYWRYSKHVTVIIHSFQFCGLEVEMWNSQSN
jgi:hypothetical protein